MRVTVLIAWLFALCACDAFAQVAPRPERDPSIALCRKLGVRSVRTWVPNDTLSTKPERCEIWDTTLFEYTPLVTRKIFFSYDPTSVEDLVNTFQCVAKDSGDVIATSIKTPDGHTVYASTPSDFTPDDTVITVYDTVGYLLARILNKFGSSPYYYTTYWTYDDAHRITAITKYGYYGMADSSVYSYDDHGNLTRVVTFETQFRSRTDGGFGMVSNGLKRHEREYTYDSLDRLTDSRVYTTNDRYVRRYHYPNDTSRGKTPDIVQDSDVVNGNGSVVISVHSKKGRYENLVRKDSANRLVYLEDIGPGGDLKEVATYDSLGRPLHRTVWRYNATKNTATKYHYQSNGLLFETVINEFRDKKLFASRHAKCLYTYATRRRKK